MNINMYTWVTLPPVHVVHELSACLIDYGCIIRKIDGATTLTKSNECDNTRPLVLLTKLVITVIKT